jgi:hypothetical protein
VFLSALGVAGPHELGSDQIPHQVPAVGVASRLDFHFRSPLRYSVSVPRSCYHQFFFGLALADAVLFYWSSAPMIFLFSCPIPLDSALAIFGFAAPILVCAKAL